MCCGDSYRQKSKNVAKFQILTSIVSMVAVVMIVIIFPIHLRSDYRNNFQDEEFKTMSYFSMIGSLISLIFAAILYSGVKNEDKEKCRIWYNWHCLLLGLEVGTVILTLLIYPHAVFFLYLLLIDIIVKCCFIDIVNGYIENINFSSTPNDKKNWRQQSQNLPIISVV